MARQFCTNCGKEFQGAFCTHCGTRAAATPPNGFSSPIGTRSIKTGIEPIDRIIADRDPQQLLAAVCIMISAFIMLLSMLICYFVWKSDGHLEALTMKVISKIGSSKMPTEAARALLYYEAGIWFVLMFLLAYLASCAFALMSIYNNNNNIALLTLIGQIAVYLFFWIIIAIIIAIVKNASSLPGGFLKALYMGCATYFTSFCWTLPTWFGAAALLTMSRKG